MNIGLIVGLAGVLVAGLAGILGVWMERDAKASLILAGLFSALILFASTIELGQTVFQSFASARTDAKMATLLVRLSDLSENNPALSQFVAAEIATQARTNPGVVSRIEADVKAKGGDPKSVMAKAAEGRRAAAGLAKKGKKPGASGKKGKGKGGGKPGKQGKADKAAAAAAPVADIPVPIPAGVPGGEDAAAAVAAAQAQAAKAQEAANAAKAEAEAAAAKVTAELEATKAKLASIQKKFDKVTKELGKLKDAGGAINGLTGGGGGKGGKGKGGGGGKPKIPGL